MATIRMYLYVCVGVKSEWPRHSLANAREGSYERRIIEYEIRIFKESKKE